MGKRINFKEFSIAKEIYPMIKVRVKKILGLSKKDWKIKSKAVLIVDVCIIGDFLHYLPAVVEIAKNNKEVDMIVSEPIKPLAERIKGVRRVFVAKTSYKREIEKGEEKRQNIQKEYQKAVIIRISPEAYRLIKNVKFSEIYSNDYVFLKYILHMAKNMFLKKPIKQSRQIVLEILGIRKDLKKVDSGLNLDGIFSFNKEDYAKVNKIHELNTKEKIILVHTGSGWESRLWQNEKWVELIKNINRLGKFRFIFIGSGQQEKMAFNEIKEKLNFKVYSLIEKVDLKELFLAMKKCDYFLGVDSGPRNLAHFANLRSITIRGPGTYFMPLNKKDIVIDNLNGLSAAPFFSLKNNSVRDINSERVFEAFKKLTKHGKD